jgi:predicted dinucleotide-binding enzyme
MRVAVIGTGNVGAAQATALRRGGHEVVFGTRTPEAGKADQHTIAEAVATADVSILAVPFAAAGDVIAAAGGFAGKIVIDATNPLGMIDGGLGLSMGHATSGAEQMAAQAPGAKVFKAFNQTGWENIQDARPYAARPVMFVAGDDDDGKKAVLQLVGDAGFEAVDLGALRTARLLEPFGMLWIELGRQRGFGSDFSFALQRQA